MMPIAQKIAGKINRTAAQRMNKTPLALRDDYRCVSFCFDDFPRTACENGAKILEDHGVRGTFYTCFGLLDTDSPSGPIASLEQVAALAEKGHEIGCHTYDHVNCTFIGGKRAAASCAENIKAAATQGIRLEHFAYPQGGMSPATKKIMQDHFTTARSILPGINRKSADAHCLKSVPVYEHHSREAVLGWIDQVESEGGWLILYTHDVCGNPSPYGASEKFFRDIVTYCANRNLPIRTVGDALEQGRLSLNGAPRC